MANLLHNDPSQTIPAANANAENINSFLRSARGFENVTASSTALTGASQMALLGSGQRVGEAGQRFHGIATPRNDAILQSAQDATRVGDEGASALNATDIAF